MNLVYYARSATKSYRQKLQKQIDADREEFSRLTKQIEQGGPTSIQDFRENVGLSQYYSSWIFPAIHIGTSVPALQSVSALASHFAIPAESVSDVLNFLVSQNLVIQKDQKFQYNVNHSGLHLSDKSYLSRMNHNNLRHLMLSKPWTQAREVHYSSIFAVSKKDIPAIRDHLVAFIQEHRTMIGNSGSEEPMMFICDFMSV
jgi:hypothetical protein